MRTPSSCRAYSSSGAALARVLCTDGVDDVCVKIFQQRGHDVDVLSTLPEAELCKIIGNYDGLVVRSATKVNPEVMKHATKMKIIGRAGVGVDNINVPEATRRGIMVMNTPGGNTVSTAQLAMSLVCNLARKVPAASMSTKSGKWERKKFEGVEMSGKTLGIVGCGRIGQVVASTANTMGMRVLGFDPVLPADVAKGMGIQKAELEQIWRESDFITLHTPLTPDTKNLVNKNTIAMMKDGVHIVNCARGGIVDEADLLEGLKSGKIGGAALDVFTTEPPGPELQELILQERLVCTPHLGASTEEAQINVARDVAVQMCDTFDGTDYVGVVNVSYMSMANLPPMKPFLKLADLIGSLAQQMTSSGVSKVVLKTWGGRDVDVESSSARKLLLASTLKGMLLTSANASATLVSAPFLAEEQGISASLSQDYPQGVGSPYLNLVSLEVTGEDGSSLTITGSVFGSNPHIVQFDEYTDAFAFAPDTNHLLTFRNEDKPGAIAGVLDILQEANVNIASLNVARHSSGNALCFISLDNDIPTHAMKALQAQDNLRAVKKVYLHSFY